jgi:predicted nucleotidyltransferase
VNARLLLDRVTEVLAAQGLEAILIGNAAAALHGAPVTTLALDFFFRDTPLNRRKLKAVARELGAAILRPYYPVSNLFRVVRDDDGMQLDFMPVAHGIRSFESLRSRASRVAFGGATLLVADLKDIIRSKRAAGRPRDIAVLSILEATLDEKQKQAGPGKR